MEESKIIENHNKKYLSVNKIRTYSYNCKNNKKDKM